MMKNLQKKLGVEYFKQKIFSLKKEITDSIKFKHKYKNKLEKKHV